MMIDFIYFVILTHALAFALDYTDEWFNVVNDLTKQTQQKS